MKRIMSKGVGRGGGTKVGVRWGGFQEGGVKKRGSRRISSCEMLMCAVDIMDACWSQVCNVDWANLGKSGKTCCCQNLIALHCDIEWDTAVPLVPYVLPKRLPAAYKQVCTGPPQNILPQ